MHLTPLAPSHIPDLTRLINAQIAPIPPHWTLIESQVAAILQKPSLWEIHYADEEPPPWTWTSETLCIVEDDHVLAAARFDHRTQYDHLTMASGRWLVGDPAYPEALKRLLDELISKREHMEQYVFVNGRTDFGIGWSGIPTTDTHVMQALAEKGFVPFQKWLVMTADISHFAADDMPLPSVESLRLQWAINESPLEWHLNLYDGETQIGECQSWGIPSEFASCSDYALWMQIEWLGVEPEYQRRGLARRLMHEQFRYHARRGTRYCLLYTELDNTATKALNASLGFTTDAEVWGWMWKPQ